MPEPTAAGTLWICETLTAGPDTPAHVRRLTSTGPHRGGGANSLSLCGRKVARDIKGDEHVFPMCRACAEVVRATQDSPS